MQINEVQHGFRLLSKKEIPEANVTAFSFTHEKSGARLLYLKTDDDNKVFSISFRTPPTDDTGVAHIVEHSTLCGSRKYPLKEPFVELVKGSLNTFLNAMTYPDKTMYPVASRNDKDFQNLMDVYLDAVFYPAMRENPQVLMQEGWHYEIEQPDEPLRYSGVVYNEMKGALSSPDDLLESKIMTSLYPDTTYHYESGGDPAAIPQLTQEKFVGFHAHYYHPSNSYIYLYGDMDIDEKLAYLDKEYLSHFTKIPVPSHIDAQKPFPKMRRVTEKYPVSTEEDTKGKTFLSLNWVVGESKNVKDMFGLEILEHALLRTAAAPLRKVLIDAHLGKDVDSNFETDLMQPFFSIIINNSEADRQEKFLSLVQETLAKLAKDGLDRTLMEASLNLYEFKLREADFGTAPKGLIYGIRCMKSWLYDGDATSYLFYEDLLKDLRAGLDNGYFEGLIHKYFLNNSHASLLVLEPSTTLGAEKEEKVAQELAARKEKMSPQDIENVIAATKALKKRQQTPDSPEALAKIPVLAREDIRKTAYELPLEEKDVGGVKLLYSDTPTNGIDYFTFYFDASAVPQADLSYAYLLTSLLGCVDTQQHSYMELANLCNLHTGGISFDLAVYPKQDDLDSIYPKFKVRAKVLGRKLPKLGNLLREILTESVFTNKKRIKELLEQEQVSIEMGMQRGAHTVVASRLASYFTAAGAYADEGFLPYYTFVKQFLANFDVHFAHLQEVIKRLLPRLFNINGLVVSLTTQKQGEAEAEQMLAALFPAFSSEKFASESYHFPLKVENDGFLSASQVQYVGTGANFKKLGFAYTGTMHVLETLLRYGYFWTKVRVQGGAYGAFTNFRRTGEMFFGSYRDPNLKETLDVFKETANVIQNFSASDREMTKAIIGTMSGIDTPLTPKMKGEAAAGCYLRGITYADRQKQRDEILAAQQEDIRALAPLVSACLKQGAICVFGGEAKLKENAGLFGRLTRVME